MPLLDFNYLIVSNQIFDMASLEKTISFFGERGIRSFVWTVRIDLEHDSVANIRYRLATIKERLKMIRPRGVRILVCPDIYLRDGISRVLNLHRFTLRRSSKYLFGNLPLFEISDSLHADLNVMLFQKHLTPIYTSFENNIKTCANDICKRLIDSHAFIGCLDLNFLTALSSRRILLDMLDKNICFLPCISNDLSNYVGTHTAFQILENDLTQDQYVAFCRILRESKAKIITPNLSR